MNIPNAISLFRIALVPPFVLAYVRGQTQNALLLLLICAVSDVLDGAIARKFNMITSLGKILDPLADKLLQATMLLCAAGRFPGMWLLFSLQLLREISLGALGLYVMKSTGRIHSARWYGKLCTAALYALMLSLLLVPDMPAAAVQAATLVCSGLMIICLVMYALDFIGILREEEKKDRA